MYPSGEMMMPLPMPCSIWGDGLIPGRLARSLGAEEPLESGGRAPWGVPEPWPSIGIGLLLAELREVTETLTTAGVTRAATASTALSSETSEETLLLSSGAAALCWRHAPRCGRA